MAEVAGPVIVVDAGDGASRSPLAAVRALGAAGHRVVLATSARRSLAAASRWVAATERIPVDGDPALTGALDELRAATGAVEVFACSDRVVVALRPELAPLLDKVALSDRARRAGVAVPEAVRCTDIDALRAAAASLGYPVVVKAATLGATAAVLTRDADAATVAVGPDRPVLVQAHVDGPLEALAGVCSGGRMVAAVQQVAERTWPPGAGVSCAARTVPVDEDRCDDVVRLLDGLDAMVEVQYLQGRLIDVNPRPYGSLPLAVAAGANLPAIWCRALAGEQLGTVRGRPGQRYRWIDADLRALLHQAREGRDGRSAAVRALRPRRATAHSIWDAGDPRPALVRAQQVLGR